MSEEFILNETEYKKAYNELLTVSYTEGVLIPILFQSENLPKLDVDIEVDEKINDKLEKLSAKRDEAIDSILNDEEQSLDKIYDKLENFYVKEVRDFIKKYPQFKKVGTFEEINEG